MSTKSKNSQNCESNLTGTLKVCLRDSCQPESGKAISTIQNASVSIFEWMSNNWNQVGTGTTDENGCVEFELPCGDSHQYAIAYEKAFGFAKKPSEYEKKGGEPSGLITLDCDCVKHINLEVPVNLTQQLLRCDQGSEVYPCQDIVAGQSVVCRVTYNNAIENLSIKQRSSQGRLSSPRFFEEGNRKIVDTSLDTFGTNGPINIITVAQHSDGSSMSNESSGMVTRNVLEVDARTTTSLTRTETSFTEDTAFWTAIRNSTDGLSFNKYLSFMDWIFCGKQKPRELSSFESDRFDKKNAVWQNKLLKNRYLSFTDSDAYRVVKAATEAFVMVNCGVLEKGGQFGDLRPFDLERDNAYLDRRDLPLPQNGLGLGDAFNNNYLVGIDDGKGSVLDDVLPYLAVIRRKLPDIPIKIKSFEDARPRDDDRSRGDADECFGLLQEKLANPCLLELIWSYWHEEGMLVQTMNALSRRFQNIRSSAQDPLANLEMDPLRPLNNLLWSYIQDEQHRLTINRRNYEYDHHYGLRLEGKAVQDFRPVDTRSKFLEAFHHLLRLCTVFYKQDDDTTVKADAFPVLNALKEVHLILSQGAHNQFGDLPSTARIEMLMQQWLLARPEFRELLPTRIMVAYPEPWMDRVDAMKKLQGWTDTSVLHFRNLGMFGEQLLLSIRWGHWSDEFEPVKALNWARFFRPQAQGYIHAYRAATGVDLSVDPTVNARVDSTLPSVLLQRRLASQQRVS